MQLHYCHIAGGNFGDDLNLELWPALFPGIGAVQPETRLYGVGTVLGGKQPVGPKVVLGSGCGYRVATALDAAWRVYWVRGPASARVLGLDPSLAIGDGAVLWPGLQRERAPVAGRVGLIPHFRSDRCFDWADTAMAAGLHHVDARWSPGEVARELATCERVLCESLHGAIFCDAMGIPWRAVVLARRFNDFKWRDWLDGLRLPLQPVAMPVELLRRLSPAKSIGNALARAVDHGGPDARNSMRPLRAAGEAERADAAARLRAWAEGDFQLSDEGRRQAQRNAMRERCLDFAADHGLRFSG